MDDDVDKVEVGLRGFSNYLWNFHISFDTFVKRERLCVFPFNFVSSLSRLGRANIACTRHTDEQGFSTITDHFPQFVIIFPPLIFFLSCHHRAPNECVVFTVFTIIFWKFLSSSNWNCVNNLILRIIWSNSTWRTGSTGLENKDDARKITIIFSLTLLRCYCSSQMCSHFTTFHNYWQSKSSIGTNFLFLFVYSITCSLFFLSSAIFFLWVFSLVDFPPTFPHFHSYTHFSCFVIISFLLSTCTIEPRSSLKKL